jgi:hypothetical protein
LEWDEPTVSIFLLCRNKIKLFLSAIKKEKKIFLMIDKWEQQQQILRGSPSFRWFSLLAPIIKKEQERKRWTLSFFGLASHTFFKIYFFDDDRKGER